MKFNNIALAALALIAAPAFATIQTGGNIGQASYVFMATNSLGSYAQDLAISTDAVAALLNGGQSFTQSVLGAEWTKFLAYGGTNTQWTIEAAQPIGFGFNPGEINGWNTINVNQKLGMIQNSQVTDGVNNLAVHFGNIDTKVPAGSTAHLASPVATLTYSDNGLTSYNTFFNTRNAIGTASQMVYITNANDVTNLPAVNTLLTTTSGAKFVANFDGTNVSIAAAVAPVPEPSTYALLAAGLLAVGFVARRRQQG